MSGSLVDDPALQGCAGGTGRAVAGLGEPQGDGESHGGMGRAREGSEEPWGYWEAPGA